jgi:hypothetical protein
MGYLLPTVSEIRPLFSIQKQEGNDLRLGFTPLAPLELQALHKAKNYPSSWDNCMRDCY